MSQKLLNIPKTTFSNLEYIYADILEVRFAETKQEELDHKKGREINARITFHYDDCYLQCREIFDSNQQLIEYYYDWYAGNGEVLLKFHAHYHPVGTPEEITQFDPWHWHVPKNVGDKDGERQQSAAGYTIHNVLEEHVKRYILHLRRSAKK